MEALGKDATKAEIHEKSTKKKRKMKTIQKDTTKAQMHEKSTKNEKSYRKPARRTRTKNPRKKTKNYAFQKTRPP